MEILGFFVECFVDRFDQNLLVVLEIGVANA